MFKTCLIFSPHLDSRVSLPQSHSRLSQGPRLLIVMRKVHRSDCGALCAISRLPHLRVLFLGVKKLVPPTNFPLSNILTLAPPDRQHRPLHIGGPLSVHLHIHHPCTLPVWMGVFCLFEHNPLVFRENLGSQISNKIYKGHHMFVVKDGNNSFKKPSNPPPPFRPLRVRGGDSYAAGLRDGLALALARSPALVTDLLATYDAPGPPEKYNQFIYFCTRLFCFGFVLI